MNQYGHGRRFESDSDDSDDGYHGYSRPSKKYSNERVSQPPTTNYSNTSYSQQQSPHPYVQKTTPGKQVPSRFLSDDDDDSDREEHYRERQRYHEARTRPPEMFRPPPKGGPFTQPEPARQPQPQIPSRNVFPTSQAPPVQQQPVYRQAPQFDDEDPQAEIFDPFTKLNGQQQIRQQPAPQNAHPYDPFSIGVAPAQPPPPQRQQQPPQQQQRPVPVQSTPQQPYDPFRSGVAPSKAPPPSAAPSSQKARTSMVVPPQVTPAQPFKSNSPFQQTFGIQNPQQRQQEQIQPQQPVQLIPEPLPQQENLLYDPNDDLLSLSVPTIPASQQATKPQRRQQQQQQQQQSNMYDEFGQLAQIDLKKPQKQYGKATNPFKNPFQ